jgi:hypothetical protein
LSDGAEHKSEFSDHTLGMHRKIDRRDFIYGAGVGLAASLIPGVAHGMMAEPETEAAQNAYPPLRSGMRGIFRSSASDARPALVECRRRVEP